MLPKKGKKLHRRASTDGGAVNFEKLVAKALRAELGSTHQAVKTVMWWTGASESAVKNWFAGSHEPSAKYLIALMRHSDLVLVQFLWATDRRSSCVGIQLSELRSRLLELVEMVDDATL